MKKLTLAATLVLAPSALLAQASSQAQTGVSTSATVQAGSDHKLSAEAQASVDANLRVAREKKLPEEPIRQRVAEGQAKGASDAQIAEASGKTLADLQGSFDAMVRAGRANPSDGEVARGAHLLARGFTGAQLEAVTNKAPSDRSLVVAFETLSALNARGVSTGNAVAQLERNLAARASDAQLRDLSVTGSAAAGVNGALNGGGSAGAKPAAAATAGVAGAVNGVLGGKKP